MYLRLQYVKQEREVATSVYHHLEYGTMLTEKDGMAFHLKSAPHEHLLLFWGREPKRITCQGPGSINKVKNCSEETI